MGFSVQANVHNDKIRYFYRMMNAELGTVADFVEIIVDPDAMYLEVKIHVIIVDMGMACSG